MRDGKGNRAKRKFSTSKTALAVRTSLEGQQEGRGWFQGGAEKSKNRSGENQKEERREDRGEGLKRNHRYWLETLTRCSLGIRSACKVVLPSHRCLPRQ